MTDGAASVVLLSMGGTISSVGSDRLDMSWYIENGRSLGKGELLASIPEAATIARITEMEYPVRPSHALRDADWIALVRYLDELVRQPDVDGVVVTHGTNTLEETAYFLSLVLPRDVPVVLTGAMRPASAIAADGPLNLIEAIRVAASPSSRGRGVMVVVGERIFAARDVQKTSTYGLDAFRAPDSGPIGSADLDGTVRYRHSESRLAAPPVFDLGTELPRVDVVCSYVGADGAMIDAAVAAGAQGIVSAGTGAGRATPAEQEALVRAQSNGVVVCQSSRVGSGKVALSPGLRAIQFVAAGDLGPWKARCLLALALTITSDPRRIQEIFESA